MTRTAFVATSPPQPCGITTFTPDLATSGAAQATPSVDPAVLLAAASA